MYCLEYAKIYNPERTRRDYWRKYILHPREFSKKPIISILSGRSSGVERNLAKVEVEGSNPFARSKKIEQFHFNKSINKIIDNTINKQPTIFCIK